MSTTPSGVSLSEDIEHRPDRPTPYRVRVRWIDPMTKRRASKSEAFGSEEAARAWVAALREAAVRGVDPNAATLTPRGGAYAEAHLTLALRGLESKTCTCRAGASAWFRRSGSPAWMITNGAVDRAVHTWIADGASRSTVKNSLAVLVRLMEQAHRDGIVDRTGRSKGWLAAFRDATLFKVCYAFGLRRSEVAMLDVGDFTTNPAAPALGGFGCCQVRFGKAMRGSPPRRRAVAAVMPWAVEALGHYLAEVRPRYPAKDHPALWLTERGGRISARRHSNVSHQFRRRRPAEHGPAGHENVTTTLQLYTRRTEHHNRILEALGGRATPATEDDEDPDDGDEDGPTGSLVPVR